MSRFVFDSYAILAMNRLEEDSSYIHRLLTEPPHQRWMSVINVGEVYYQTLRAEGEDNALAAMESLWQQAVEFVDAGYELTMNAARIKAQFPLSYADCFAAALAQRMRARLVTGDPEFRRLESVGIIQVEWLASKSGRRRR